jgi:hypothetical protein
MNQMMARARDLPDSELADVLAGKSVAVPQFAAMLAAMGRQSLRTAVAGAQAGQAKQPNKKDQVLASMQPEQAAGLPALPAQNMEQLGEGMADGGIVAFSGADGSSVKFNEENEDAVLERLRRDDPNAFQRIMRSVFPNFDPRDLGQRNSSTVFTPSVKDVPFTTGPRTEGGALLPFRRPRGASNAPTPPSRSEQLLPPQDLSLLERPAPDTTMTDMDIARDTGVAGGELPKVPGVNAPKATTAPDGSAPGGPAPTRTGTSAPTAGLNALTAARAEAPAGRKSPIDELTAPLDEIRKQVASGKEQAQGEFLMTLGARIMRTPNLGAAIGQGIQEGLPGLAANRKEANMLLKDQRDYNLNLAKAKEAAAQGRDDLAFKYADLAEKAQYHAGMIGAYMARAGSANTFGPKQFQAARQSAAREVDAYISKLGPKEKRQALANRESMIEDTFSKIVQAAQYGPMTSMPDPRVVLEPPKGGNVLSRD